MQIENFKDYVDLHLKDKTDSRTGAPLEWFHEVVNDHFEIAITKSNDGKFQQVSFVNSIATVEGGTHVTAALRKILDELEKICKKVCCNDL